jgi:hypothetical protein
VERATSEHPKVVCIASAATATLRVIGLGGELRNSFSIDGHRRVPAVYLGWANPVFLAFFSFNRISNLRVFNAAFSSIPTAPTKLLSYQCIKRLLAFHLEHLFPRAFLAKPPTNIRTLMDFH